jgi:hypothetical protein
MTSEVALAFSWWQAGEATLAGATTGAIVGSFVPGLGTLLGAGVGALSGFIAYSVTQLFATEPTTSANQTAWLTYAEDVAKSIAQQSQLIVDQQINQVNILQQSQLPFTVIAQKWEQENYNVNISPTSPYQFVQMLNQTGFLAYAEKLIGGVQSLWMTEQAQINAVNEQLSPHSISISYNVNPTQPVGISNLGGTYVMVVIGNVSITDTAYYSYQTVSISKVLSNGTQLLTNSDVVSYVLSTGVYLISATSMVINGINPQTGMVLVFQYSGNSYTPVSWSYNVPASITVTENGNTVVQTITLPQVSTSLPLIAEQVAVSMEGAAQTEYSVLNQLGYSSSSQIPPNMLLPSINLNVGNFSNFNSSLQAYNLYLSEYVRELLQIDQTLQNLSTQGKLAGLQQLSLNLSNPLSLYGQYGGFLVNGTIVMPNGQVLRGLFLIQPYGGPLTLNATGGTIGSGGAIAYQLVQTSPGQYGLGQEYTLSPGTIVQGHVSNPGTLGVVNPLQKSNYLNVTSYQMPFSSSSAVSSLMNYLKTHPLVLIITLLFLLLILVVLIRAIL